MESQTSAPSPALAARALGVDVDRLAALNEEQIVLARSIGRDLVCQCGTCPKEPVSDCTCGWAAMNRRAVQGAVAKGMTREQIVAVYRSTYGDQVLAMLPNEGLGKAAWILPYSAAVVGFALVLVAGLRARKKSERSKAMAGASGEAPPAAAGPSDARRQLARELEEMD